MKTKIIGLTGGIGSGKTTIARYIQSLGVPVYIADEEAKKILLLPEVIEQVSAIFGKEVLVNGIPDRSRLAEVVFNNPQKLEMLNGIIHPKVSGHFNDWLKMHRDEQVVIKEAAILFESGSYKDCDKIILVTAPPEIRVQRVMARDNATEAQVLMRMQNQWCDEQKIALSDYVIDNTNLDFAKAQAYVIIENLRNL